MQDSAKYLIHAQITANGVVERSDVVGAIFGQTEGLLGDELEIRELQESSKLGRIDVTIDSESGISRGQVTISSGLDRVETAILAASLETIDRVGPCRASLEVVDLEDVRQAKRREVVERATSLLEEFDDSVLSSHELIEEVRRRARTERITEFEGYPAGPRVSDSDAIIVVEGRADVLRLLQFGIKNAIAVEGTNVPDAIARLTTERTVTAFLDGDRGGELILKELAQVGNVDYVAFAPVETSVEDLSREDVMSALREKVEFDKLLAGDDAETLTFPEDAPVSVGTLSDTSEDTNGETTSVDGESPTDGTATAEGAATNDESEATTDGSGVTTVNDETVTNRGPETVTDRGSETVTDRGPETAAAPSARTEERAVTLSDHIAAVIEDGSGLVRLLDEGLSPIDERPADEVFEAIESADDVPTTVLVDGSVDQRVLDIAAQRGVDRIVASGEGQFVKKPTSVHLQVA
jgi:DNA primase